MTYFHPNENISIHQTANPSRNISLVLNSNIMMSIDQGNSSLLHPHLPIPLPQSYRDVQAAGLPVNPLEFPTPMIHRAQLRSQQCVFDHHTHYAQQQQQQPSTGGTSKSGRGKGPPLQLQQPIQHDDVTLLCHSTTSDHNYWIKNQIPAIGRNFYLGTVVVRVNGNETNGDGDNMSQWMTTNKVVLIKTTNLCSNARPTSGCSRPLSGTL